MDAKLNEGLSAAGLARIDEMLAGFVAEGVLPGAAILVARHGRIVHRATLGLKDLASGAPLAEDTIYRIFSMTKPVTAAAMMILHDRGLWSPDDPIARHLPEFAGVKGPGGVEVEHAPTLGELMTHTAGFGYGIGLGPHDATDAAYIAAGVWEAGSLAEFAQRVAAVPLAYQPGQAWRYSLSMDLQGAVIERLSGQSLADFMGDHIFTPLGMDDTDFFVPADKLSRLASLYHMYGMAELTLLDHPSFVRDPRVIPKIAMGGAGLYSTIGDYGRFAQMLLNGGELDGARLLSAEAVAMMTANHLSEALLNPGVTAGMQRVAPGRGYGFNGAVFHDPALAGAPVGRGTYQWDGASGVWFWIDPENDLVFVGMIQRMMQEGMPRLQDLTQQMISEALSG
ncbi:serine hydrolase [Phenylobacterium aquaticum]|uniref:serine hydrolase domain-containing protein n=1 Tax=Phenylobacterium aquaticum TaxID=1763816 RepID=UPI0026EEBDF5|nr:serine hydrolase domain-containing protein [Phenylobacterium aquaticum]